MVTDPIADLLARIRNGGLAKHAAISSPNSRLRTEVARVLKEEGYVDDFSVEDGLGAGTLRVRLRYHDGDHVITGMRRESKPGQRRYVKQTEIPQVMNGLGVAILTTSQGVMTGKEAKSRGIGGEVMCTIW